METVLLVGLVALAAATLVTFLAARRTQRMLADSRAELQVLASRVETLSRVETSPPRPAQPPADATDTEYLITSVGLASDHDDTPQNRQITGGQFLSLAGGETLIKVLSLGYGVRRALSAESRNRIGFEMRREVKRARRQRRRDLKEARRSFRAGQRDESDAA